MFVLRHWGRTTQLHIETFLLGFDLNSFDQIPDIRWFLIRSKDCLGFPRNSKENLWDSSSISGKYNKNILNKSLRSCEFLTNLKNTRNLYHVPVLYGTYMNALFNNAKCKTQSKSVEWGQYIYSQVRMFDFEPPTGGGVKSQHSLTSHHILHQ